MFTVRYDQQQNIVHYKMWGFWTLDTVRKFGAALGEVAQTIPQGSRTFDSLNDALEFPVQSSEVAAALGTLLNIAKAYRIGRTAIVVGSSLNRMQAERTLDDPSVKVFMSMKEAEAWLTKKP